MLQMQTLLREPLCVYLQGLVWYLLQEAAVESCESSDREEHLERHWRVLQTYGWVLFRLSANLNSDIGAKDDPMFLVRDGGV